MRFFWPLFLLCISCSGEPPVAVLLPVAPRPPSIPALSSPVELLVTPDPNEHARFTQAILTAKKSIALKMFHLSDPAVVKALISAAKHKVLVEVILDQEGVSRGEYRKIFEQLKKAHVEVVKSSPGFSITHEKSMIVDSKLAFITAINLTQHAKETRDFGIVVTDPAIITEMESVFATDLKNAETGAFETPNLTQANLVWSPINSRSKLKGLIESAEHSIHATVENLGDRVLVAAFISAAAKNIPVQIIVPMCDKNRDPYFNYLFINELKRGKVDIRVMPDPSSAEVPYMHAKMLLVDGHSFYIGSINFSTNSTQRARELGIILDDAATAQKIETEFAKDWTKAIAPPDPKTFHCNSAD